MKKHIHVSDSQLITLIGMGIVLLIPITFHWLQGGPWDDALRYCAHAVDPRPWGDTTWLAKGKEGATSPGWDHILEGLHMLGINKYGLLDISVTGLFALFIAICFYEIKEPMAAMLAITVVAATTNGVTTHWCSGRPLMITSISWILNCMAWDRKQKVGWRTKLATAGIAAAQTWIHGCWYLLPTLALPILINSNWERAIKYVVWTLLGVGIGATLTLHRWHFLNYELNWGLDATTTIQKTNMVGELKSITITKLTGTMLIGLCVAYLWKTKARERPHLIAIACSLCWIAAFWIGSFWWDMGIGSLTIWLGQTLAEATKTRPKLAGVAGIAALVALLTTILANINLGTDGKPWFTNKDKGWEPQPGHILYNSSMEAYFANYFHNPEMHWKTAVGYESTAAPINIELGWYEAARHHNYQEWLKRIRPGDRISLLSQKGPPKLPGIEWKYCNQNWWVGKLIPKKKPHKS